MGNKMDGTILPSIYFHTEPKLRKISNKILGLSPLESWQFVYTPNFLPYLDKKDPSKLSIPTYVAESKDLVLHGIMLWRKYCKKQFGDLITEMVVLTDNGNGWKFDGGSLLESLGVKKHLYLAAVAHAYMSTCDNGTNGPAKATWRGLKRKNDPLFTDVMRSTCVLLKASQDQKTSYIRGCWRRNFLLDITEDQATHEYMKKQFHAAAPKWAEFHAQCRSDYDDFINKKGIWTNLRTKALARQKNTGSNRPYYDDYGHLPKGTQI